MSIFRNNLTAVCVVVAFAGLAVAVSGQSTPSKQRAVGLTLGATDVQVGPIIIDNNYTNGVRIILYHADDIDNVFATWNFRARERSFLDFENQRLILGGDWLIQIEFGNGVKSPRRAIARVGVYRNGTWECLATEIYSGK